MSRVSVVIVTRNRREMLRGSLEALGAEHQIVVVDNGSTDGTPELEVDFPAIQWIRLPKNFGLTKALNLGIRAAEREHVLLLHDDVLLSGEAVSQLAGVLEESPEVGVASPLFPDSPQIRDLPSPAHPYPEWHTAGTSLDQDVESARGAALMVRKQFLTAMRHIDERYGNYGSAADICAQAVRRAAKKVRIVHSIKGLHHAAGGQSALLAADRVIGTIVFLGKYYGFAAGLRHRLSQTLSAVFTLRWGMAKYLLSNQKVDGSQS